MSVWWLGPCLEFSLLDFPRVFLLSHPTLPSPDPARVLNMPPVIYVPVGIHGYIRCPVDAEPPATVIKWNKDGRPLQVEKVLERRMWGTHETSVGSLLTLRCCLWGSGSCQEPSHKALASLELLPMGVHSWRGTETPLPRAAGLCPACPQGG